MAKNWFALTSHMVRSIIKLKKVMFLVVIGINEIRELYSNTVLTI
jgi:hypothetical protein